MSPDPKTTDKMDEVPKSPGVEAWQFVAESRSYPVCRKHPSLLGKVFPQDSVRIECAFGKNDGLLTTALFDLERALSDLDIPANGDFPVVVLKAEHFETEEFELAMGNDDCRIRAGDREGIRRGIYFLIDLMLSCGPEGIGNVSIRRKPVVATRISRIWYGPRNRPEVRRDVLARRSADWREAIKDDIAYRDELLDDFDYYPDSYLSVLAREGVNGLWFTDSFHDLCRSAIIPEYGVYAERKLKKLRAVVQKCRRYGIKLYMFCLEPRGFGENYKQMPVAIGDKHPEFNGYMGSFCTSTALAREYLEEATYNLFSEVPELGGIINLCVGEMKTHCYSWQVIDGGANVTCPRCAHRAPADVLAEVLFHMKKGMERASPTAELIAWPYSQAWTWNAEMTVDAAKKIPHGVILQHNFESHGRAMQCGKERTMHDYWLAWPGPSEIFKDCAAAARANGNRISAKLQLGNSNELTTIPYIPVPGILYKKYRAIHELGVSAAMQCWLIGSCPSLMTKAGGMLSFSEFPQSEEAFLHALATPMWGNESEVMVQAWQLFEKGFTNCPYSMIFNHNSPMNAATTWPLYLRPVDRKISPPFRDGFPPSGDRFGEFLGRDFSLDDAWRLCSEMTKHWQRGMDLLRPLFATYRDDPDRLRELNVAEAVNIQLNSCANILNFYREREAFAYERKAAVKLERLRKMEHLVNKEIENSTAMTVLCRQDSRLGLHSETGKYLFHPDLLNWRIRQLEGVLADDFVAVKATIQDASYSFPWYVGAKTGELAMHCGRVADDTVLAEIDWRQCTAADCLTTDLCQQQDEKLVVGRALRWKCVYNTEALFLDAECLEPDMKDALSRSERVEFAIEMARMWPCRRAILDIRGERVVISNEINEGWQGDVVHRETAWHARVKLPWGWLSDSGRPPHPIRVNVTRMIAGREVEDGGAAISWGGFDFLPKKRLHLPDNDPAHFGWLILEPQPTVGAQAAEKG